MVIINVIGWVLELLLSWGTKWNRILKYKRRSNIKILLHT